MTAVAALKELQDRIGGKPLPAVADKQPTRVTFQWKDSKRPAAGAFTPVFAGYAVSALNSMDLPLDSAAI